jgi:CDP-glucose 4,6-dehydratase
MKNFYKNKKVLITGHTGFKGAWLSEILLLFGANIIGVSLKPTTNPSLFELLGLEKRTKNYFADICDVTLMKKIFTDEKPDIVFHLAAQPIVRISYDDPLSTFATNVMGTANILEAVRETPTVRSAVIITTDKVYENKEWHFAYRENDSLGGHDPYSSSKAAADIVASSYIQSYFGTDQYNAKHKTLVAIARAGNVIGGGDWAEYRLIPDIIKALYHDGKNVEIRNPKAVRPWQHVLEPLHGYMILAEKLYNGENELSGVWNFGPHNESFVDVQSLAEGASRILGKGGYSIVVDKEAKHEAHLLKLDINKAISLLKWKPKLHFESTLSLTFEWYKHYYEANGDMREFTNKQIKEFFKII